MKHVTCLRASRTLAVVLAAWSLAACDLSVRDGDFSLGIARGKATDEWNRTYPLAPGGQIEVVNINGRIDVEAREGSTAEVHASRTAKARTDEAARELLGKIEIREEITPGSIKIETHPPSGLIAASHEVAYTVRVPRGARVVARTVNGGVTITGASAMVKASSTNGGITGKALAGGVDASTTNGGIRLQFDAVGAETVRIETVNGGVDVRLPERAKADILAECVNGGISVSGLSLENKSEKTRRRLDARLNGGGARIEIATTNGGIRLAGQS